MVNYTVDETVCTNDCAGNASDEVTEHYRKFGVTETISKQVGTGLFLFYILGTGAIISILYSEVTKMLK